MRPILIKGHERALTQIKFNRDGDLLFSVAKDLIVNVWYSHNGERLGTYRGHQGAIWTVDVDPKCEILATGAADNTVKLWNVQTGQCLLTYQMQNAVKRVEFSSDSSRLLAVTEQRMGITGAINVLKVPPFEELEQQEDQNQESESDVLLKLQTPEGALKCNVAGWSYLDQYIIACHEDGSVRKYHGKTGELLKTRQVHLEAKPENPLESRTPGNITDIQFSGDKTYFITASRDRIAKILDVDELEILKEYPADTPLNTSSITPVKDFVILGGGQEARNVTTTSQHQGKFEARFYHKIFQDEIGRVKGHFGPLNTLAVHPLGTGYASGGEDGYVRIHHFDKSYFDFVYDVERY